MFRHSATKQEATESAPEPAPHSGTGTGVEGQNPRASAQGACQSEEVVNNVYLNEMYGKSPRRGFRFSFTQSGWPVGALLASAFAAVLLPLMGWRWIFLLADFLVVVILVAGLKLRESPSSVALKRIRELRKGRAGLERAGRSILAGRVGCADEVARVIRFLTSDDAAYITGQELVVDGGLTVWWPE
ncbi:SDR family oxidoreductase [Streptomyces sp. NPDC093064]|uniref:SDR family oxidoreductase n=1 Tax=Streptomyces sp. NPDC093064 TaxID=3366020 RepID=UPI0038025ED6